MSEYRIVDHVGSFEPQMLSLAGREPKELWISLNPAGYWLEPDAYTHRRVTCHCIFNERTDAERAIARAKAINGEHLRDTGDALRPLGASGTVLSRSVTSAPPPPVLWALLEKARERLDWDSQAVDLCDEIDAAITERDEEKS